VVQASVAAIADEYTAQAHTIARALAQRQTRRSVTTSAQSGVAQKAVTARGHRVTTETLRRTMQR